MVPQCIKIWSRVFSALCDKNSELFFIFLAHVRPPGVIIPPPHTFYAAGYFSRRRRLISPQVVYSEHKWGGGEDEVSYGDSNLRGRSAGRHNFFVIELCKKIVVKF